MENPGARISGGWIRKQGFLDLGRQGLRIRTVTGDYLRRAAAECSSFTIVGVMT